MIHQLRVYEIFEHNKAAFHARFRDHALAWPDEAEKSSAWAAFMADEEWKEIKRVTQGEHGGLVGQIEDRVLMPTDYSHTSR